MPIWNALFGGANHTSDELQVIIENLENGKAVMLDVRSQEERDAGYLKESIFIPITELPSLVSDESALKQRLPVDKIVYCHCKAGVHATSAAQALTPLGYDVRTLPQSYEQLVELGFKPA